MVDEWKDPPLSAKARVAAESFGWLIAVGLSAGAVAWCRALKRLL